MTESTTREERPRDPKDLGPLLREARKTAELTQEDVVDQTSLSQPQLSRVERGKAMPTNEQAAELVALYRLDDEPRVWILDTVAAHHEGREDRRFTVRRGEGIIATQIRMRELEVGIAVIRSYSGGVVLGQLQTRAYAAEIMQTYSDHERVTERLRRGVDHRDNRDRRYQAVMTEGALRLTLGSHAVMAEQCDHLARVSELPNVDLRIIGTAEVLDRAPLVGGGFNVYDERSVVLSQVDGFAELDRPDDVRRYLDEFAWLQDHAQGGANARAILAAIAEEHRRLYP